MNFAALNVAAQTFIHDLNLMICFAVKAAVKLTGPRISMGLGKRTTRKKYPPHPCWRCRRTTTRYALCDYCYRQHYRLAEQQGWGDYLNFIKILHEYEKAAQKRLTARIKQWSCKDYSQAELQAILGSKT